MTDKLPLFNDIWKSTCKWQPDERQQQIFAKLYEEILLGNSQLNLTRITQPHDFWEKHIWDSLIPMFLAPLEVTNIPYSMIDIGTGAGFPGIPIAIAFPKSTVTLLDSTRKKINFIDSLLPKLELKNVKTLVGRAENIGKQKQGYSRYDIALIRAVGSAFVCAEYALPLLKKGGIAILYRGLWQNEDTVNLESLVNKLGGKIEAIEQFNTPLTKAIRHCIYLRK